MATNVENMSCFLSPAMMVRNKREPADVRVSNRMMIFGQLFPEHALSCAQLARRTGLSRVAACKVVSEMLEKHWLMEAGIENPLRRGKKGTLISVDRQYWQIIAVDLSMPLMMQGAVLDLQGNIVYRIEQQVTVLQELKPETVIAMVELLSKHAAHILAIGVSVPGIVDERGVVLEDGNLRWKNMPLQAMLEAHFSVTCSVNNDANSALVGERFFGKVTSTSILVYITVGIGAALLIDDSLVLGMNDTAGEIGHVVVDPHGMPCACGKRGCLETLISTVRLRQQMEANPEQRERILRQAGQYLGCVLVPSVSLLDIDNVFIYGPDDIVSEPLLKSAERILNTQATSQLRRRSISVQSCGYDGNMLLRGESICIMQKVLLQDRK